jgi:hypothetical protein
MSFIRVSQIVQKSGKHNEDPEHDSESQFVAVETWRTWLNRKEGRPHNNSCF